MHTNDRDELLTEKEVARWLRIPQATLRSWRRTGRGVLPDCAVRLSDRTVRYSRAKIERLIATGRLEAA